MTKFIATHIRRHWKSGKKVASVSSNLRHMKIIAIQYSKESSSCVVACSIGTFYFIINS